MHILFPTLYHPTRDADLLVEHQQGVVAVSHRRDHLCLHGLPVSITRQQSCACLTLGIGQLPEKVYLPRDGRAETVSLLGLLPVKAAKCTFRCKISRRQIGQLRLPQRGLCFLHLQASHLQVGVSLQSATDEGLQVRVGK